MLDDARQTPAHAKYDGSNYYPTSRWVLFGHHFAAIAGAGPLVGPVLAAQFGWAPGFFWLVSGCCLAGAVHDMITLWASTRRGGRSLAVIAREEIGPVAGVTGTIAILFILLIALAGLGFVAVFAGAANTPLACTLMGIELFGATHGVYIATACFLAYLCSGHSGIYLSQRIAVPKVSVGALPPDATLRHARTHRAARLTAPAPVSAPDR